MAHFIQDTVYSCRRQFPPPLPWAGSDSELHAGRVDPRVGSGRVQLDE